MSKHDLTGTDAMILGSIPPGGFSNRFELSSTNKLMPSEVFESLGRLKEQGLVEDTEKDGPFVKLTEEGNWVRRRLLSHESPLSRELSAGSTDAAKLRVIVRENGMIQVGQIGKVGLYRLPTTSELDAALDAEIGKLKLRRTVN